MRPAKMPKYQRLAEELSRQILDGSLPPGSPLPSTPELAKKKKVSQATVREAFRILRESGLVVSSHGQGTYVRVERSKVLRKASERYEWEKQRARCDEDERRSAGVAERDANVSIDDMRFKAEFSTVEASPTLAADFRVLAGTRLLHRVYTMVPKGENNQLHLNHSYIPVEYIESNPELLDPSNEPWPGGTLHQLCTVGIEVAEIVDQVTARPPTPDEARRLGITSGIAVLVIRKIAIDTERRVVEIANVVMAGDRTELEYRTPLTPWEKS